MSEKHTPGPYKARDNKAISVDNRLLAQTYDGSTNPQTLEDMRAALWELRRDLERLRLAHEYERRVQKQGGIDCQKMEEFASPEMRMARAAIAKAKGEA